MLELISESAPVFITVVFALTLLIGSFLNVVIHRLPIMMEREWRMEAQELLKASVRNILLGRRCQEFMRFHSPLAFHHDG